MVARLGITFELGSDSDQVVMNQFNVINPDTAELALHAVYIVDKNLQVIYRKVALRRPISNELIDAIDAHRGVYPQSDPVKPRRRVNVAYPTNNHQALLAIVDAKRLPPGIDAKDYNTIFKLSQTVHNDEALIAVRTLMEASVGASEVALLETAALIVKQSYFKDDHPALQAANNLKVRLQAVTDLESRLSATKDEHQRDQIFEALGDARAKLTRTRAVIDQHADAWGLRGVKTAIRGYREVALAAYRNRSNR